MTDVDVALVGIGVSVVVTAVSGAVAWGALSQKVKNHDDVLDIHRADIKAAADKAEQIPALIKSIEHLGDAMSANVKHLIDRMDQSNTHIHEQLTDIKEQIKPKRRTPSG